jgi:invasion protein IalB
MNYRIVSARTAGRSLVSLAVAAVLMAPAPVALAQQQPQAKPTQPARPAQPAQRATPAKPSQAQPAQPTQPGQPPQQSAGAQPGQEELQLIYSPWTKFCLKGEEKDAKQVCFTGRDARIESGMPVVAAVIIEPEGDPKKILRVTLPLGMLLQHGTRVILDRETPLNNPYVICFANGCMSDYEWNADLIGKMKKGQQLTIQAINSTGQPISLPLPLNEFAKAYDGPPTDPKVFEEQQKKLEEELQRRALEARQKLEQQGQQSPKPQ